MQTISYTAQSIGVDPVSRVEGHLKVDVTVDIVNGGMQVVEAKVSGTMFRGIEKILVSRSPLDAPDITQRICGVCPVSHGLAATKALEKAAGTLIPSNGRIMRNLVLASNFLQSHILHFYVLSLLDFVDGPQMPPWQPSWKSDKRITGTAASALVDNYTKALEMRRKCHEMGALFGGRLPHPPAFVPGGLTTTPRSTRISKFKQYLAEIIPFIRDVYIPDVQTVMNAYPDYSTIGGGYGNLFAFGCFDLDDQGATRFFNAGRIDAGSAQVQPLDLNAITERVTSSWYSDQTDNLNPSSGATTPVYPKNNAYSWLKAPRYNQKAYEAGPLARMKVNGEYTGGVSVADRHLARAQETLRLAQEMGLWADQLQAGVSGYGGFSQPSNGSGIGLAEAPRGALGHWVKISGGSIASYQIITPTCWNASPRDSSGLRGPIEQALIGTPVADVNEPVEVVRVIHSFDPCLSCAVHVMRPEAGAKIIELGHYHSEEEFNAARGHHSHGHEHPHVHDHEH